MQCMRSQHTEPEGLTSQMHAKGKGFGPVVHVATSQLLHFTLASIIKAKGSSNATTVSRLITDMAGAQTVEDGDMGGALFAIDRGS